MKEQGGGNIVNIGTVLIMHAAAGLPASAALMTKGGVHALTTNLASELAADNIRVNAVAPGVIRTPIYGDADVDAFGGVALLKRVGEVRETTEAVLYLATAGFTTGVILPVDGGFVSGRAVRRTYRSIGPQGTEMAMARGILLGSSRFRYARGDGASSGTLGGRSTQAGSWHAPGRCR